MTNHQCPGILDTNMTTKILRALDGLLAEMDIQTGASVGLRDAIRRVRWEIFQETTATKPAPVIDVAATVEPVCTTSQP